MTKFLYISTVLTGSGTENGDRRTVKNPGIARVMAQIETSQMYCRQQCKRDLLDLSSPLKWTVPPETSPKHPVEYVAESCGEIRKRNAYRIIPTEYGMYFVHSMQS